MEAIGLRPGAAGAIVIHTPQSAAYPWHTIERHYHQPTDDVDPSWNYDGMVDDARLNFAVGYTLAQSAHLPAWIPGDEFEAARKTP